MVVGGVVILVPVLDPGDRVQSQGYSGQHDEQDGYDGHDLQKGTGHGTGQKAARLTTRVTGGQTQISAGLECLGLGLWQEGVIRVG